jgi:hypothetical protein
LNEFSPARRYWWSKEGQAQAFALVVELNAAGYFSWREWADELVAVLREAATLDRKSEVRASTIIGTDLPGRSTGPDPAFGGVGRRLSPGPARSTRRGNLCSHEPSASVENRGGWHFILAGNCSMDRPDASGSCHDAGDFRSLLDDPLPPAQSHA